MDTQVTEALGPALVKALGDKGYSQLTAVQEAVLDPALAGRDLRITSQTGSGKTLAIGFAFRELVEADCKPDSGGIARPCALVVAPTRELAQQVEAELRWLYANTSLKVACVTGGSSYRDERRALGKGPTVVIGTPGRLLDHLKRGGIDNKQLTTVVLDEADRMLELGFREELDAILALVPPGRRTHLVSATFPRAVKTLADSVQKSPAHVEGTRLGAANADIDHVVHLIDPRQKVDAIINLLLRHPDAQTLVFARTRIEVADVAAALAGAGFAAASLSGEMDQAARNRALASFKRGTLKVLVATDVAARGIDVQDITRVIHAELPTNADSYTHRSGRTGRAGRKGTSCLLVPPAGVVHATRLLRSAGVVHRFEPIPTAQEIRTARDQRIVAELTAEPVSMETSEDAEVTEVPAATEAKMIELAERLVAAGDPVRTIARLLARTDYANLTEAREIRAVSAPRDRNDRGPRDRNDRGPRAAFDRGPRGDVGPRRADSRGDTGPSRGFSRDTGPSRSDGAGDTGPSRSDSSRDTGPSRSSDGPRRRNNDAAPQSRSRGWVPFRVSWGEQHGADPRRLLAMVCRRGDIRGKDVGAIRVDTNFSIVEVAEDVAETFATEAGKPDTSDSRDARVSIRRGDAPARGPRSAAPRTFEKPRAKPAPAWKRRA